MVHRLRHDRAPGERNVEDILSSADRKGHVRALVAADRCRAGIQVCAHVLGAIHRQDKVALADARFFGGAALGGRHHLDVARVACGDRDPYTGIHAGKGDHGLLVFGRRHVVGIDIAQAFEQALQHAGLQGVFIHIDVETLHDVVPQLVQLAVGLRHVPVFLVLLFVEHVRRRDAQLAEHAAHLQGQQPCAAAHDGQDQ